MEDRDLFLDALRALRGKNSRSYKDLAECVGACSRSVSNWLKHGKEPDKASVERGLKCLREREPALIKALIFPLGPKEPTSGERQVLAPVPEPRRSEQVARLLSAGGVEPAIHGREYLHPALHPLFPGRTTPADLRHRAWGALVQAMLVDADGGGLSTDAEETLRGVHSDHTPVRLGWTSLEFRARDGREPRRGRIIRTLASIADDRLRRRAVLLLAGMAEPGFVLRLAFQGPEGVPGGSLPFLRHDGSGSVAGNLAVALLQDCPKSGSEGVLRALAFYGFTAAKVLYDRLLPEGAVLGGERSLFRRVAEELASLDGLVLPVHLDEVLLDVVPVRRSEPGCVTLWEQYSHLAAIGAPTKLDGLLVLPLAVVPGATEVPPEDGSTDGVPPPLSAQVESLRRDLDSWRSTGVLHADEVLDSQVRFARCQLPEVSSQWTPSSLSGLAVRFAEEVAIEATHSHLVCLVGPYGTGKTTVAQRLFHELQTQNPNQWMALAWDPVRRLLEPVPLYGRDALVQFKRHDLSRVLLELGREVTLHLSPDVAPGARLLINASEMNAIVLSSSAEGAAGSQDGRAGMEAIEAVLREVTEKYMPTDVVAFVAMQAASLVGDLGRFFAERPDLVMGRARIDSLWLVRGDCLQLELSANQREDDEDPLVRLLEAQFPGCPTLNAIMARRMYIPLAQKARILTGQLGARGVPPSHALAPLVAFVQRFGNLAEQGGSPIDEYLPRGESLALALRFGIGTLVSSQVALWNGFHRQFWDMIRNEAELLTRSLERPDTGGRTGHLDVENLARSLWLESLGSVRSRQLGLNTRRETVRSMPNASIAADLPPPAREDSYYATAPGGKGVSITPWHTTLGTGDNLDTCWVVRVEQKGSPGFHWLVGVDIAYGASQKGIRHVLDKAGVRTCVHIDPSAVGSGEQVPRYTCVLHQKDRVPAPTGPRSRLAVPDVPAFLSALLLRVANHLPGDSALSNPDQRIPVQAGDLAKPTKGATAGRRIPCVFDVWIEDNGSPDPDDWTVSHLFMALADESYSPAGLSGAVTLVESPAVDEWVREILKHIGADPNLDEEAERGLVFAPREVRQQLWRWERDELPGARRLVTSTSESGGPWEPLDILPRGLWWEAVLGQEEAASGRPPVLSVDTAGVPSSIKLCRAVQVAVDGSNQIHRTRKLRAQRLYASRAVEQGEVAILAVAVVRWDGDGGDGFTPRPGLEVKREGDVLRILQRTQGGPSEKGLREVSREEDRLPTLCLVGPDPENGDQPRVRWFAPEE